MHFVIRRRQLRKREEALENGEEEIVEPEEPNWLRGLGIIVALSLHELFGGMAIGLEMTVSTVWFMTGAISVHKLVLAFCIGMEIMMAHTRWILAVVYLLVFSIVTPIGVGIGIAVSESSAANEPSTVSGILQGLACGTLIYVVFFEIVAKGHAGLRVLFSSLAGFVLMFGLQIASNICNFSEFQLFNRSMSQFQLEKPRERATLCVPSRSLVYPPLSLLFTRKSLLDHSDLIIKSTLFNQRVCSQNYHYMLGNVFLKT